MPKQDINQIAAKIVSLTAGEIVEPTKNPAAVALGRLGGLKGGKARAKRLSPEDRARIASLAAKSRWMKKKKTL